MIRAAWGAATVVTGAYDSNHILEAGGRRLETGIRAGAGRDFSGGMETLRRIAVFALATNIVRFGVKTYLGVRCPRCASSNLRRSRRRGILERALSLAGRLPYRCRECDLRFYFRVAPLQETAQETR